MPEFRTIGYSPREERVVLLFQAAAPSDQTLIKRYERKEQTACRCRHCGAGMVIGKADIGDFKKAHKCPSCQKTSKPRRFLAGIFTGPDEDAHGERMSEKCLKSFEEQWQGGLYVSDSHREDESHNYGISGPGHGTELKRLDNGDLYIEFLMLEKGEQGVSDFQAQLAEQIFCMVAGVGINKSPVRMALSIQGGLSREDVEQKNGNTYIHHVQLERVSSVRRPAYHASKLHPLVKSETAKGLFSLEELSVDVPAEIIESSAQEIDKSMDQAIAIEEANRLFHEGYNTIFSAWHDFYSALDDSEQETEQKLAIFQEHWQQTGQKLYALHAQFGFSHEREKAMMEQAMDSPQAITPPGPGETESASSIKQGGHDVEELMKRFAKFAHENGFVKSAEKEISSEEAGFLEQLVDKFFAEIMQQKDSFKEQMISMLMGNAEPAAPPEEEEMQLENPEDKKPEEEEEKSIELAAEKAVGKLLAKAGIKMPAPADPVKKGLDEIKALLGEQTKRLDLVEQTQEQFIQGFGFAESLAEIEQREKSAAAASPPAPAAAAPVVYTLDGAAMDALLNRTSKSQDNNKNGEQLVSLADYVKGGGR